MLKYRQHFKQNLYGYGPALAYDLQPLPNPPGNSVLFASTDSGVCVSEFPAPSPTSCMALGKLLNFSVSALWKLDKNIIYFMELSWVLHELTHVKPLKQSLEQSMSSIKC